MENIEMKKLVTLAVGLGFLPVALAAATKYEKEFDEAFAAGKPLAAERAFKGLIAENPETDPIRYFNAAEVARQTGRESLCRDRLSHYVRVEKKWNDNVGNALKFLCRVEPTADRFVRLSNHVEHDERFFEFSLKMLNMLRTSRRGEETMKLSDAMFGVFKSKALRARILQEMLELRRTDKDFPFAKIVAVMEKHDLTGIKEFGSLIDSNGSVLDAKWVIEYCLRHNTYIPQLVNSSWSLRTAQWDKAEKLDERLSLLKKLKSLEPKILQATASSSNDAVTYYRVASYFPKVFFADAIENAQTKRVSSHLAAELFKKIPVSDELLNSVDYRHAISESIDRQLWSDADARAIAKTSLKAFNASHKLRFGTEKDLIEESKKLKDSAKIENFIRSLEKGGVVNRWEVLDLRQCALECFVSSGNIEALAETFKLIAESGQTTYNASVYHSALHRIAGSNDRKLKILADCLSIGGSNDFIAKVARLFEEDAKRRLEAYKQEVAKQQKIAAKQKKPYVEPKKLPPSVGEMPQFAQLAIAAKGRKVKPSSELMDAYRAMMALAKPNSGFAVPAAAHELAIKATKAYGSIYPNPKGDAFADYFYGQLMERYYNYVWSSPAKEDRIKFFENLVSKQGKNSKFWTWCWDQAGKANSEYVNKLAVKTMSVVGNERYALDYRLDPMLSSFPAAIDYKKLSPSNRVAYIAYVLRSRAKVLSRNALTEGALAAFAARPLDGVRPMDYVTISDCLGSAITNDVFANAIDEKIISDKFIATARTSEDFSRARALMSIFRRTGKMGYSLKKYLEAAEKLSDVNRRYEVYQSLLSYSYYYEGKSRICIGDGLSEPGRGADDFGLIVGKYLVSLLKSVGNSDAPTFSFRHSGILVDRLGNYNSNYGAKEINGAFSGSSLEAVRECIRQMARLACNGSDLTDSGYFSNIIYRFVLCEALNAGRKLELAKYARFVGRSLPGRMSLAESTRLLTKVYETKNWEAVYLMSNAIDKDVASELGSLAMRYRAEVAKNLPGIYPVAENHPAYGLYVAADELSRNNPEAATAILRRNLGIFEREAVNLPPDFTAWAVDQIRMERGRKDELIVKARNIATQVLSNESKITPELAAAMLLVRAETFRDQQNFEAAKLEYQSIRNNPAYHNTPSGRKAMFRAVGLMIDTGNASGAEATLEYWLSQPDAEIQAEAHCFLARIAFERKDYDECIKQLREVFAIDFTHTEARFLQGRWKLATNSEVDDAEVLIGNLSDRTAIRPGQQLSITVQDRNLSVAGGGSSIPIVIDTTGGDREKIYLYPSPRDPNLFKGVIDVRLASPAASNLVLEVRGDDVASYAIDPEFLKVRGLPANKPKSLKVVDDGRLAIGAGAPRTEKEQSQSQIEAMVSDGVTVDSGSLAQSLRPGNPLYIALSDKDRSLGGEGGTVKVEVSTTSGDLLRNVELKETGKCTGVFRGTVPTALPPPRAFASDTAVGFNAGDVINSTRDGMWKSLADNRPGKWFEVDTMGSHLISEVKINMPMPSDITSLRLSGKLGGETIRLGGLPAGDPAKRLGIKVQYANRNGYVNADLLRAYLDTPDAPGFNTVKEIAFNPKHSRSQAVARFMGAFVQPKGFDYLRFRIDPINRGGDALRTAVIIVLIDGKEVFSGRGTTLIDRNFTFDMDAGAHRFEMFAAGRNDKDNFRLLWEPLGADAVNVPTEWFSAEKNPELLDFVSDKAKIERTGDGYVAKFVKPVRLRKIKWDFLGCTSPDVTISSLSATNSEGVEVLPVVTDFSDAQQNNLLEVAPGDVIKVKYIDENTSAGTRKVLEKSMPSSFKDATVGFYFEELTTTDSGAVYSNYRDAYRFVPGDTVLVSVNDSDLDVSEKADRIKVVVESKSGHKKEVVLVEQIDNHSRDTEGVHSGRFLGVVKTKLKKEVLPEDESSFPVEENDTLSVNYEDRENTRPGVPCVRVGSVQAIKQASPILTLFHANKTRVPDTSSDAMARLALIRRRPGNENVKNLYRSETVAFPMSKEALAGTNAVAVNIAAPILVRVNDPSRARHAGSMLKLEVSAMSEILRAERANEKPLTAMTFMRLGAPFNGVKLRRGGETGREARTSGSFNAMVYLVVGAASTASEEVLKASGRQSATFREGDVPALLGVNGNDQVRIRVLDADKVILERMLSLSSDGSLSLMDSSWKADRPSAHVGERFYIQVEDSDCDQSDAPDIIKIDVKSVLSGKKRQVVLTETLPHSGVFNGMLKPHLFAPDETIPAVATGAVASTEMLIKEERIPVLFGDSIEMTYRDEHTLAGDGARTLCVTGSVYQGSDGSVRLYSKRFRDFDQAVLVQFRLAECLFEQAKEHRKLKNTEKSAEFIAKGKFILEEALKNFPDSSHVVQGEYLLANLYQELATEQRDNKNLSESRRLYSEALARFSQILAIWPDGEYAARSQYHKALCLEMLEDYNRASEEYVKMTYLYPESELVGDAAIRLATYYYKQAKRYDISARIYKNFQERFPNHEKAPRALFMCGSCYVKEAEKIQAKWEAENRLGLSPEAGMMYLGAAKAFDLLTEKYRSSTSPELKAQSLYWAGDVSLRRGASREAYVFLKRTVLEYPETDWARRARGLLLQESQVFQEMEEK